MIDLHTNPTFQRPDPQVKLHDVAMVGLLPHAKPTERAAEQRRKVTLAVAAAAIMMGGLCGCGHDPIQLPDPIVVGVESAQPVAVSCVPSNLKDEPTYVDSIGAILAAAGAEDRYQLVWSGRLQRDAYLATVRPVLKNCKG